MSTLLVVLAAAMGVNNDPKRISTQTELGLSIQGDWELVERYRCRNGEERSREETLKFTATAKDGQRVWMIENGNVWIDEGKGRFRIFDETFQCLTARGIYKWDGGRLVVCYSEPRVPRPTQFQLTERTCLSILTRAIPGAPDQESGKYVRTIAVTETS